MKKHKKVEKASPSNMWMRMALVGAIGGGIFLMTYSGPLTAAQVMSAFQSKNGLKKIKKMSAHVEINTSNAMVGNMAAVSMDQSADFDGEGRMKALHVAVQSPVSGTASIDGDTVSLQTADGQFHVQQKIPQGLQDMLDKATEAMNIGNAPNQLDPNTIKKTGKKLGRNVYTLKGQKMKGGDSMEMDVDTDAGRVLEVRHLTKSNEVDNRTEILEYGNVNGMNVPVHFKTHMDMSKQMKGMPDVGGNLMVVQDTKLSNVKLAQIP